VTDTATVPQVAPAPAVAPQPTDAQAGLAREVREVAAIANQLAARLQALELRVGGPAVVAAPAVAVADQPAAVAPAALSSAALSPAALSPGVLSPGAQGSAEVAQAAAADGERPKLPARSAEPMVEIQGVLRAMFALALATDPEDGKALEANFDGFKELMHHLRKGSPLLHQELFNYKWRPLCTRARLYLADPADPSSFAIVQTAPERFDARTETVRVFLRADKRMPPPITLRRDDRQDGAFRIETSSL